MVAGGLVAAACSGGDAPEFHVRNTAVVIRSSAAFTRQNDLPTRIESTIEAALSYWGGTWQQLDGKTVVLDGSAHVTCGGVDNAIGCYDGDAVHVSTQDAGTALRCVEETVLVHEVGHAIIGDPGHADPRWMDFSSITRDLEGRTGYGDGGEETCPIYVSIWRHPPNG
mgnify:CR=1 FL=1